MGYINKEKIVGYTHKSENTFYCDDCFQKEGVNEENFEILSEDEIKSEDLFICDSCGEKFEEY